MKSDTRTLWFHLFDVALNIVIIVAIVGSIRTFLVSPFRVEGNSMLSTLEHKQYIIINKLAYYTGEPERGDVVVLRPPNNPKKPYVKRIIGMPGDTVLLRGGDVYIQENSEDRFTKLEEEYLNENNYGRTYQAPPSSGNTDEIRFAVPTDRYFVMGDNRQNSLDSRTFHAEGEEAPYIPRSSVLGRVWFVAMPLTDMKFIEQPIYADF